MFETVKDIELPLAPFQKILIKSRSSSSFTSNLKDFAGPYSFLGAPALDATIKIEDPGYLTCGSGQTTLSLIYFQS